MIDFTIGDHGSVLIVTAHTPQAKEWLKANVDHGSYNPMGDAGRYVERRYIGDLYDGMLDAGFKIERT